MKKKNKNKKDNNKPFRTSECIDWILKKDLFNMNHTLNVMLQSLAIDSKKFSHRLGPRPQKNRWEILASLQMDQSIAIAVYRDASASESCTDALFDLAQSVFAGFVCRERFSIFPYKSWNCHMHRFSTPQFRTTGVCD